MLLLALNILQSGVPISMLCAIVGLIFAFVLISSVIRLSPGNDRMRQIASAIQEGAKAYLNRQVITISAIAVVIFILLLVFRNTATGMGFLVGATCSLAAGFIGMRIAVLANVRTAQAATQSRSAAMRVAFNGGAVTGLLVVGLALLSVGIFYTIAKLWLAPDLAVKSLVGLARDSAAAFTRKPPTWAPISWAKSRAISKKMIRGTRPRSRTTSAITWVIAPAWRRTFSKLTRSA